MVYRLGRFDDVVDNDYGEFDMTWADVFKIVLGGGLVLLGNILVQWWTDRRDNRKLKRDASASALLAAIALEVFADRCIRLYEGRRHLDNHGRDNSHFQALPPEPEFNDKIDWTAIDPSLADETLTFGHLVRKRAAGLKPEKAWQDYRTDTTQMSEDLKERALELARTAVDLASSLRKRHGLRSREDQESWELPMRLDSYEAEEVRKARKEREEREREHVAIEDGRR